MPYSLIDIGRVGTYRGKSTPEIDQFRPVEVQRSFSGSAYRGEPNQANRPIGPGKMPRPALATRVEEPNHPSCSRILGVSL
jgi:hypothetical protein